MKHLAQSERRARRLFYWPRYDNPVNSYYYSTDERHKMYRLRRLPVRVRRGAQPYLEDGVA